MSIHTWRWKAARSVRNVEVELEGDRVGGGYKGVGIEKNRMREVDEWNWLRIFNWLD